MNVVGSPAPVVVDELCEATSGGEAVVKSGSAVFLPNPGLRIYDRCATDRSLVALGNGYGPPTGGLILDRSISLT